MTVTQTATVETLTVPDGVCGLTFTLTGAGGGGSNAGKGGLVQFSTDVDPGDQFDISVGALGGSPGGGQTAGLVYAGSGGSAGGVDAGGGGGMTFVKVGNDVIALAGGGGGGGGGIGGSAGPSGSNGGTGLSSGSPGLGGTPTAAGGVSGNGAAGVGYKGGDGGPAHSGFVSLGGGGGGGGGYYGGGGGGGSTGFSAYGGGGGGGGANHVDSSLTHVTNGTASAVGAGQVDVDYAVPCDPPDAPTLPIAESSGPRAIDLSFCPTSSAYDIGYQVKVDDADWVDFTVNATGESSHLGTTCDELLGTVPDLRPGTVHTFWLRAYYSTLDDPNYGDPTDDFSYTLQPVAPATPINLAATPGDQKAILNWDEPDDGGSPITAYEYQLDNSTTWLPLDLTTKTIPNLPLRSTPYVIKIRAKNAVDYSGPSATVSFTAESVPGTPTQVTAVPGNRQAALTFTPPAANGKPIDSYEYSVDNGVTWVTIPTDPAGPKRTGVMTGLRNGTTYQVILRAHNVYGYGVSTQPFTVILGASTPDKPTGLTVTGGDRQATLRFTPPVNNGGSAITSYEYSIGGAWLSLTAAADATGGTWSAVVSPLSPGTSYTFQVRARNIKGGGAPSDPATLSAAGAPDAPLAPTVTNGNAQATLQFAAPAANSSPITGYEVSVGANGTWLPLTTQAVGGDPAVRSGVVTGLTNGQTPALRIRAVNAIGAGPASPSVGAHPMADRPSVPLNLTAAYGNASAILTFTPPATDGGGAITAYQVDLGDGSGWQALVVSGTGTTRTATVATPVVGQTYPIQVRAVNMAGEGPATAALSFVAAGPPSPPSILSVTPGDGQAVISFLPGATNGGPIWRYEVSTDSGASWRPFAEGMPVRPLDNGTQYPTQLRAINEFGTSGPSNTVTVTPLPPVPGTPGNFTVTGGDTQYTVSFSPVTGTVSAYEISTDGGITWTPLATTGTDPMSAVVTGQANGVAVPVAVRAVNIAGPGIATTAQPVTPEVPAPTVPGTFLAEAGNASVTVSFQPVSGPVTGYQVSTDGGTTWTDLTTTGTDPLSGTVTDLVNGTSYPVTVRAMNNGTPGAQTTTIDVTPEGFAAGSDKPGAPAGLAVTAGDQSLDLAFQVPDSDGGSAITSYEVSTDDGATWAALTTAGDNSITGTVSGLTNGTAYTVRVRALNANGAGTASDPATGTPAGADNGNGSAPAAPTEVTVEAGTSSIVVRWTASEGATGYTAFASPGPSTCESTDTSCVLGAVAGTTYTVTVVAHSDGDDSEPSEPSGDVTPTSPEPDAEAPTDADPLTTTEGPISSVTRGAKITVVGDGYAANSTVLVVMYSEPVVLGRAVAGSDGSFSLTVTVPGDLEPGSHTIAALGVDENGDTRTTTMPVSVKAPSDNSDNSSGDGGDNNGSDNNGSNGTNDNGSTGVGYLPKTGGGLFPIGVFLIVVGAGSVLTVYRPRRFRPGVQ